MPPAYWGFEASWSWTRSVADGVFLEAFLVVDGLGGEGVADELGVEVEGVVGGLEGEAEVVHGEDVFEELGVVEVADAAGLAALVSRAWAMALVRT